MRWLSTRTKEALINIHREPVNDNCDLKKKRRKKPGTNAASTDTAGVMRGGWGRTVRLTYNCRLNL